MTRPLQLLIPAAGKGSRFADVGFQTPKPLIPIWDIPMLIWVLNNFPLDAGDGISILCQAEHRIPEQLGAFTSCMSNTVRFIEIDYWTDGPAHSLELLLEGLEDESPAICANSDQFIFSGLPEFVTAVRSRNSTGQILTMEASGTAWSYVGRDGSGKVNRVVEKEEISSEATVGIYGWDSIKTLRGALYWQRTSGTRVNNEYYVAPSYQYLIESGLDISTHSVGEHGIGVHGLGIPADLEHFLTLKKASDFGLELKSKFAI
jgi:dTDP-glucose pyrophosphorylase